MNFVASTLAFGGPAINRMAELPTDFGIEIFVEWGSPTYWRGALSKIMAGREGGFSVHSPFTHLDISVPGDDQAIFDRFTEVFDICKEFKADFYVVHPNGHLDFAPNATEEEHRRNLAARRLVQLNKICKEHGLQMVVENIGFTRPARSLFNQSQFLQLFADNSQLCCLIDTGHAVLADYNIYEIQKELRNRIIAYHIHDNRGTADDHLRIGEGTINWDAFAEGFRNFTPEATMVMEYNCATVQQIIDDKARLRQIIMA